MQILHSASLLHPTLSFPKSSFFFHFSAVICTPKLQWKNNQGCLSCRTADHQEFLLHSQLLQRKSMPNRSNRIQPASARRKQSQTRRRKARSSLLKCLVFIASKHNIWLDSLNFLFDDEFCQNPVVKFVGGDGNGGGVEFWKRFGGGGGGGRRGLKKSWWVFLVISALFFLIHGNAVGFDLVSRFLVVCSFFAVSIWNSRAISCLIFRFCGGLVVPWLWVVNLKSWVEVLRASSQVLGLRFQSSGALYQRIRGVLSRKKQKFWVRG